TVARAALVEAVEHSGYSVPQAALSAACPIELSVEGMTCASCVGRVERALKAVPGVTGAAVNLVSERATIEGSADAAALIAAIATAGYDARLIGQAADTIFDENAERAEKKEAELRD